MDAGKMQAFLFGPTKYLSNILPAHENSHWKNCPNRFCAERTEYGIPRRFTVNQNIKPRENKKFSAFLFTYFYK
jgi:hypothetical protein